ncbi:MAG: DEAD/DEAH box helicase [Deltaproteobacteria bacterium]|nr:DEAD/DEAH box helicase [Deltaproteobacteria bacterium]
MSKRKTKATSSISRNGSSFRKKLLEDKRAFLDGIGKPESDEFIPDAFQLKAISEVINGKDTLVVAPTGSGKTFIAISAIGVFLSLGLSCIYTTPLKALSNTKYIEFREKFKDHRVGLLTGDRKIDTDAKLLVATTEIFRNEMLRKSVDWGLVILDEVHFLSDPQRGAVWEESIILCSKSSVLLLLSATIGNPVVFRDWVSEVRSKECSLILERKRPVDLRFGILHQDFGAISLNFYRKVRH